MNDPTNLLTNSYCKGEVASKEECSEDKNQYSEDKLSYFSGNKDNLPIKSISENGIAYNDNYVYDIKPLTSYYEAKYAYNNLNEKINIHPFILSRSTSLGSGKYSFHWLGNNLSNFITLNFNLKNSISVIFNFNIFGIPFTGSDISGFMDNSDKELCIRWHNFGIFYPFSITHNFFNFS